MGHAQCLRHGIAPRRGDVGVAPGPGQRPKHQRAQHVALVPGIAAAVLQRATRHAALEDAGGDEELSEEARPTAESRLRSRHQAW